MTSMLSSQGVVLATAMAAVSGTVIILALKLQKSCHITHVPVLRPCLSSGERKGEKKKKKVRFAKDVVDTTGDNELFRRQFNSNIINNNINNTDSKTTTTDNNNNKSKKSGERRNKGMPANRLALYNGILRDRVIHRVTCSY
ncbi:hypothetical protein vseg_016433 [Gypsophila vaccaria]